MSRPVVPPYAARSAQYAIFLVALILRLNCLDCKGLWYDEVASLEAAGRGLPDLLTDRFGWMLVQTPLHYFVVWLTSLPLDAAQSALLVRLPSAIAGALTTLVVYGIGRELFGRAQGLLAAAFLAFSAIHINYSQDLRPYAFLALFTALSVYCLLMAERTGATRWWAAFAVSGIVSLYFSYFALTLALPALVPYAAWIFYRLPDSAIRRKALVSFAAMSLAAVPILLDLATIPRRPPDLLALSPSLVGTQFNLALTQLTRIGIGGTLESVLQWGFALLAPAGLALAARDRRWNAVILCASLIIIPSLLMAVFRTGNNVFQRYILFTLPFYLLLVANGATGVLSLAKTTSTNLTVGRVVKAALAALVLVPFAYSAWAYFDPAQYRVFNTQPDYRAVSQYLGSVAGRDDLILVADEPALGATVLSYYWHDAPPSPLYDARDPRLPDSVPGSIYIVVSFFQNDPTFFRRLAAPADVWEQTLFFNRVLVLKTSDNYVTGALSRLIGPLEAENSQFQPVLTLRGSISQLTGDPVGAYTAYSVAGPYFGTGDEYLRTAEGYLQRGDRPRAWREALISKFMQPDSPAIHDWLAARLLEEGRADLSVIEQQVAAHLGGR